MENRNNDELELTELEQAEWVARRWSDLSSVPSSYVEARLLARVFLAQQARLAEVDLAGAERKANEAAREALTKLLRRMEKGCRDYQWARPGEAWHWRAVETFRDREYPAPTEREGARTHCGCWADRAPNEPCVCPTQPQAELRRAAIALYEAGRWSCDGLSASRQARLWEDLRDALGLPEGHATSLGVATPPQAALEPLYLVVEYQGPLGDWRGDAYRTRVRLTPEICRRIVAMSGFPVPEEGGR